MDRRQLILALGLGAGALALGWAFFWPQSPEEKIRADVEALGRSVSTSEPPGNPALFGARLNERWQELVAPEIMVVLPEVGQDLPSARRELAFAAARILSGYGSFHVDFGRLDVSLHPQPTARGVVTVTADRSGEMRRDERAVSIDFKKVDGQLVMSRIELGPAP